MLLFELFLKLLSAAPERWNSWGLKLEKVQMHREVTATLDTYTVLENPEFNIELK